MRVFEVPEPVGPWVTVLVYLPAQPVHGRAARARRRRRRRGVRRRASARSSRSSAPARSPASRSACAGRAEPAAPTSTSSSGSIDELSTSWSDRLRAPLVASRRGEGRELFDRIGRHAPAAYRAAVAPDRAIGDVRRIGALLDGERRAGDRRRPRRRRPGRRVAVPGLPPGHAGRAVRAAAAARPPRAARRSTSSRTRSGPATSGCTCTTSACGCRPASRSTSDAGPSCSGVRRPDRRRGGERRVQPAGARRRADGPRGGRRARPTASTCARSASPSASRTSSRR